MKGVRVSDIDLFECLHQDDPSAQIGSSSMDEEGDNEEDDEDDEDNALHRKHRGKLSKADGARLIPLLIHFRERREGRTQSFALCPLQACHRIALLFNISFTRDLLNNIDVLARPLIQQLEQEDESTRNVERIAELRRST